MDTKDKPIVRVVKAGGRKLRSGVIRVEGEHGTLYKAPCDRCTELVTCRHAPEQGGEILCKACVYVARVGKPSTKVKRKGDKALFYLTECDLCGDEGKTPFLPKKERPYLCDLCFAETDEGKKATDTPSPHSKEGSVAKSDATPDNQEPPATANPETAEPVRTVRPRTAAVQPSYRHACRRCRKKFFLKFRPDEKGERFICPDCFEKESIQEEKRKDRPSTRLIFKIECVKCGKSESVDFVPKSLTESICSDCFNKRRRK